MEYYHVMQGCNGRNATILILLNAFLAYNLIPPQ